MARLLVSVRSAEEARAALAGGAALIDVKEPARGPLGPADPAVWQAVRAAVPQPLPVSVALGELADLVGRYELDSAWLRGITLVKVGLAGAAPNWPKHWDSLRARCQGPRWVAVVYTDFARAQAPEPDAVLDVALARDSCAGVLFDTWDKRVPTTLDASPVWADRVDRIRQTGRLVALAGGLDEAAIERLRPLHPGWFAVRSAVCAQGNRGGAIDPERVRALARAAAESA